MWNVAICESRPRLTNRLARETAGRPQKFCINWRPIAEPVHDALEFAAVIIRHDAAPVVSGPATSTGGSSVSVIATLDRCVEMLTATSRPPIVLIGDFPAAVEFRLRELGLESLLPATVTAQELLSSLERMLNG